MLVDTATAEFAREGYNGANINRISLAAGFAKGTIYNYFPRQLELGKQIVKISTEKLWVIGTVGMVPTPVVVKNNFMNVPDMHTADWIIMTPGTLDPAHFYFSDGGM